MFENPTLDLLKKSSWQICLTVLFLFFQVSSLDQMKKEAKMLLLSFLSFYRQWGAFYLFIADFFATQIIGGAKELVVLLWLSGNI